MAETWRVNLPKLIQARRIRPLVTLEERFWAKVEPEPNSGCLLWIGAITKAGYGLIGLGRRGDGLAYAHRVAYELLRGPIPADRELDHLCRVRRCANAWHLEPVTRLVNMLRGNHPSAVVARLRSA